MEIKIVLAAEQLSSKHSTPQIYLEAMLVEIRAEKWYRQWIPDSF